MLHVVVHLGEALPEVQYFGAQDPYFSVKLLPRGPSVRTLHVSAGGSCPRWNVTHENHLKLDLGQVIAPMRIAGGKVVQGGTVSIELKVLHSGMISDELICFCELEKVLGQSLPILEQAGQIAPQWYAMFPGPNVKHGTDISGSIQCSMWVTGVQLDDEEGKRHSHRCKSNASKGGHISALLAPTLNPLTNQHRKMLHIEVYSARELTPFQRFTKQDPYVHAVLQLRHANTKQLLAPRTKSTGECKGGDTTPHWSSLLHNNHMLFEVPGPETGVEVIGLGLEIWNRNVVVDEVVGSVYFR